MGKCSDPWTYQCGKCGKSFKTSQERDQHMVKKTHKLVSFSFLIANL